MKRPVTSTLKVVSEAYPRNQFVNMGIDITRSHHERWDGEGYPQKRKGDAIPLSARIMALADVYDALRANRPYKEPFPHANARDIILAEKGKHFDPDIVDAFEVCQSKFVDVWERLIDRK